MNETGRMQPFEASPDFGIEFDMGDFDINAAFQEAIAGVATDQELALDEKVRRMEVIVSEGTSDVYRDFVDFRAMAAQMEMMCSHDHQLHESVQGNRLVSSFLDNHKSNDDDNHGSEAKKHKKETDKKKKKKGWGWLLATE